MSNIMRLLVFCFADILTRALAGNSTEYCTPRIANRVPWTVLLWKLNPSTFVGHGSLLASDRVLTTCRAFSSLSPDQVVQYEVVVYNVGRGPFGKVYADTCTESRLASAIKIHPRCKSSAQSGMHNLAIWKLERPLVLNGTPFLFSWVPGSESESPIDDIRQMMKAKIDKVGLYYACQLYLFPKTLQRDAIEGLKRWDVLRCGFKDITTLEVCGVKDCPEQQGEDLFCFFSRRNSGWEVHSPSDPPDWVAGATVECEGVPVAVADRTFRKVKQTSYRLFQSIAGDLDFILSDPFSTTSTETTKMKLNATAPNNNTKKSSRSTKLTTPIDCTCQSYADDSNVNPLNGQKHLYRDKYAYSIIAAVGILIVLFIT